MILIVHFSDIHFRTPEDIILSRTEKLASALYRYLPYSTHLLVIVSGDIAQSGNPKEYTIAERFFREIRDYLKREADIPVNFLFAPGNHDCDFSSPQSVREMLLKQLRTQQPASIESDVIQNLTSVQEAFFCFRDSVTDIPKAYDDRLITQYQTDINGYSCHFEFLNAAWCSELHERQGALTFPIEKYDSLELSKDIALSCAVIHHPPNWQSQSSYHRMRAWLKQRYDLVLSGHEHTSTIAEIDDHQTGKTSWIEANALQDATAPDVSGFAAIQIDLEGKRYQATEFTFRNDAYYPNATSSEWSALRHLPKFRKANLELESTFRSFLIDPGGNFSHPAKDNLELADIFVFPDMRAAVKDGKIDEKRNAQALCDPDQVNNAILITGHEQSGKTSLFKTLYSIYHRQGYTPLYISGEKLTNPSDTSIDRAISRAVDAQYGKKALEPWLQSPREQKIIFIDDLDLSKIPRSKWAELHSLLGARFWKQLYSTSDQVETEEAFNPKLVRFSRNLTHFYLDSEAHKLRFDLIRKWVRIGVDHELTDKEMFEKIDRAEKAMETSLVRNLVPRTPIYCLVLLQSLETASASLQNGGIAQYYQFLISKSLTEAGVKFSEFDEIFNYCSHFAWFCFDRDVTEINTTELDAFTRSYSNEFTPIDSGSRLATLRRAGILDANDDLVWFRYSYLSHFFLGRYLADRMAEDGSVEHLIKMHLDHLYVRRNANTILFLVHHTRDRSILEGITKSLNSVFEDVAPLDLVGDTGSFNDLIESAVELVFEDGDPVQNRRQKHVLRDELEDRTKEEKELEQREVLDFPARVVMLLKTMDLLGQILRTYYGTLRREEKTLLLGDIFDAPMRALRVLIEGIGGERDLVVEALKEWIVDEKLSEKGGAEMKARAILFEILGILVSAFVLKAGKTVASDKLMDVLDSLRQGRNDPTVDFLCLAARLEQPRPIPLEEVDKLVNASQENPFALRVLQTIVLRHLSLFPVRETDKQKVCSILGVSFEKQRAGQFYESARRLVS